MVGKLTITAAPMDGVTAVVVEGGMHKVSIADKFALVERLLDALHVTDVEYKLMVAAHFGGVGQRSVAKIIDHTSPEFECAQQKLNDAYDRAMAEVQKRG